WRLTIIQAMDVHNRGRPRLGLLATDGHARGDGTDGGDLARSLAGEAIRHHPAVRDAGRVDAVRNDAFGFGHFVDDRVEELHVVDAVALRTAAARARVPCLVETVGVG